jgi:hypothetical protein
MRILYYISLQLLAQLALELGAIILLYIITVELIFIAVGLAA